MKHIKFTYVDAVTGISVASQPAANGPVFPNIAGLQFAWARESRYPTEVPEFFGTCPDDSSTQVDGVLGVFSRVDWEGMQTDEMAARNPRPEIISPRQFRQSLTHFAFRTNIENAIAASDQDTKDWYEFATQFERHHPMVISMAQQLGYTDAQIDDVWTYGAGL